MYPNKIIFGLTLYDILMFLGMASALIVYDRLTTRKKMSVESQKFFMFLAIIAMAVGLITSMLFQSVYTLIETGKFVFGPMTFLGGLLGGIGSFVLGYRLFGKRFLKENASKDFVMTAHAAPASITSAHAFGRLGCLMAGCCHGKETESIFGIKMKYLHGYLNTAGTRVVPIQLYEAIFLFALCAVVIYLFFKNPKLTFPTYLISYGVWRFVIEFFRGDDRGKFLIPFLSPSQHISILLVIAGAIILYKLYYAPTISSGDAGKLRKESTEEKSDSHQPNE